MVESDRWMRVVSRGVMATSPSSETVKPRGCSMIVSGKTDSLVTVKLALAFSRYSDTGGLIDCAASVRASANATGTSASAARTRVLERTAWDTSGSPTTLLKVLGARNVEQGTGPRNASPRWTD